MAEVNAVAEKVYAGRKKIFVDAEKIDASNICEVVADVLKEHAVNAQEIQYLMNYERGITPIRTREKAGRQDVNYRINENHAAEIKTFKVGYVFSSPITLVQRAVEDNEHSDEDDKRIALLNEMMFEQGKAAKDKQLAEDFSICGVGYRMALPKRKADGGVSPGSEGQPRRAGDAPRRGCGADYGGFCHRTGERPIRGTA